MAKFHYPSALLLTFLLPSLALARPAPPQTYTDPAQGWSVPIPSGWTSANPTHTKYFNDYLAQMNFGKRFKCTGVLLPESSNNADEIPNQCIVFAFIDAPLHTISGPRLYTGLQHDKIAVTNINWENLRNPNLGFVPTRVILYDPDRQMGYFAAAFTVHNTNVYGAAAFIPTRNGFVQINAYAPFDDMPAMRQRLIALADAIAIPPKNTWSASLTWDPRDWIAKYPQIPHAILFGIAMSVFMRFMRPKTLAEPDNTPFPPFPTRPPSSNTSTSSTTHPPSPPQTNRPTFPS